jgi:GAF domain-containing protein/type IV secretory pathway VirB2 component (pilin)
MTVRSVPEPAAGKTSDHPERYCWVVAAGTNGSERDFIRQVVLRPGRRLVLVTSLVGAALAVAAVLNAWQSHNERLAADLERLDRAAEDGALLAERFFVSRVGVLQALAQTPAVVSGDPATMASSLEPFASEILGFDGGVGWIDRNGMLWATTEEPHGLSIYLSDRPYVKEVLSTGTPVVSEVLSGRRSGEPSVIVAVPTFDSEGDQTGLLVGSVLMDGLPALLPTLRPLRGEVNIIDRAGHLVYANGPVAEPAPAPNGEIAFSAVAKPLVGVRGVAGTQHRAVAAAEAPTPGWTIAVERPAAELTASARGPLARQLALVGSIVLVGGMGAFLTARRLDQLQDDLVAHTRELASLESLTAALATADTPDAIAEAVATLAPEVFGGHAVALAPVAPEAESEGGGVLLVQGAETLSAHERALVGSVDDVVAQALERSQLHELEKAARLDAEKLGLLTAELARCATRASVIEVVNRTGAIITRAASVALVLRNATGDLEIAGIPGTAIPVELITRRDGPSADVMSRQRLVTIIDSSAGSWAVAPLGDERAIGALWLSFASGDTPSERELALIDTAARSISDAFEVATSYEREHSVATTLQNALRPMKFPEVPGWAFSGAYRAGEGGVIGGDWYDVVALPGDRLLVAVGDVAGRGLRAASTMGMLRAAIRAYAFTGDEPAAILHAADNLLSQGLEDEMATVFLALLGAGDGDVVFSSAGHPPPLIGAGESLENLATTPDPPLGIFIAPSRTRTEGRSTLRPGDALVMYTDGVIERRGEALAAGMSKLAVSARDRYPDMEAEALLGEVLDRAPSEDDAVILTIFRSS